MEFGKRTLIVSFMSLDEAEILSDNLFNYR